MKTQSKDSGKPSAPQGALDEKITHLTEDLAKTASRFKVPILVALVAIVAIIAISGLVSYLGEQQEGDWSEQIYLLFQKTPAEIRADAPGLASDLEGTRIEPAFVVQYARWLFEQDGPGDPEAALALLEQAKGRHENSMLINLAQGELEQVRAASAGFELPPIPEPEEPETSSTDPIPGLGTSVGPVTITPGGTPAENSGDGAEGTTTDPTSTETEPTGGEPEGATPAPTGTEDDANAPDSPPVPEPAAGDGGR